MNKQHGNLKIYCQKPRKITSRATHLKIFFHGSSKKTTKSRVIKLLSVSLSTENTFAFTEKESL